MPGTAKDFLLKYGHNYPTIQVQDRLAKPRVLGFREDGRNTIMPSVAPQFIGFFNVSSRKGFAFHALVIPPNFVVSGTSAS